MSRSAPLFLVDAFTDQPFGGNPAAVCPLDHWPPDAWLQNVAMEVNQAETAFVVSEATGFRLRWFTPRVEVDLCGHATLAAAHVLWTQQLAETDAAIAFSTRSGTLTARRRGALIELDFPLTRQSESPPPPGLLAALGTTARYVGKNDDYLVEVEDEATLRALRPDFRALSQVDCRGIVVTARSSDDAYDFVSRFFAPRAGIDEDQVTGSAHCTLAHHWRERLGHSSFRAFQASRRGGSLEVAIEGDRVLLRGAAVLVMRGEVVTAG